MEQDQSSKKINSRLVSIDALRGFDMFWIIGGTSIIQGLAEGANLGFLNALMPQFEHVPWVGFHFYDLIMPLFLFIVGVSMPFSYGKRLSRGDTKKSIYIHMIKRVAILFFLATITQGNLLKFNMSEFYFFMGTLPAIGVGYMITTIIMLNFKLRGQIIAVAGLLLAYWALMMLVPVPGYGAGILTPKVNFATWVDHTIMKGIFPVDREYTEIVTSLTYGCTVMLGMFAGQLLKSGMTSSKKLMYLIELGFGLIIAGLLWSPLFPIIKHIWTSSFVLFVGGISFLLMALFYYIIDVLGYKKWAFGFVVIGMNAITVYITTMMFDFRLIGNIFVSGLTKRLGSWNNFFQAVAAFAVVWFILYYMYKNKSFIKI